MAIATRIYKVKSKVSGVVRLIKTTSPSAAIAFVSRDDYVAEIPSLDDAVALGQLGVVVESLVVSPVKDEVAADPVPQTEIEYGVTSAE